MTAAIPQNSPDARLQHLARRVHALGERPLYELFRELIAGADPRTRIERYAQLEPDIVRLLGAAYFPLLAAVAGSSVREGRYV
jgi:hypothetical protein